jgi:uncharacterized protein DUF6507
VPDWDIQPQGVQGVVDQTVTAAEGIQGWGTGYSEHLRTASTSAGTLAMVGEPVPEAGIVGAALSEFAEATQTDVQFIVARASASLQGVSAATMAYLEGDLDMARLAQQEALRPPEMPLPPGSESGGPPINGDREAV